MAELTSGLITYEGTHALGRRPALAVWNTLAACLGRFGFTAEPTAVSLVLDLAGDDDPELLTAYSEVAAEYGAYPSKVTGSGPAGQQWRAFLWPIAPGDPAAIDRALGRAAELRARGGKLAQRVSVKFVWQFRLRDPDTRDLLPGQDSLPRVDRFPGGRGDSSSAVFNLGAKSTLHLWLLFPFAEPTPAFRAYVDRLQAALPVSFVLKGWRLWRFTRAGTWKANKLDPGEAPG